MRMSPESLAASLDTIRARRTEIGPFAVAAMGYAAGGSAPLAREYEDAGAIWWLEVFHDRRGISTARSG
jgi:hypothetical protein